MVFYRIYNGIQHLNKKKICLYEALCSKCEQTSILQYSRYITVLLKPSNVFSLQSALAPMEQVLSQEVPFGGQVGAFLLAGHHSRVPEHAHHLLRTLQPAYVVDPSPGFVDPH